MAFSRWSRASALILAALTMTQCTAPQGTTAATGSQTATQPGVDADGFPVAGSAPRGGIQSQSLTPPAGVQAAPPLPAQAQATQPLSSTAAVGAPPVIKNPKAFPAWVADLRKEALGKGISGPVFDRALRGAQPIPRIIELDRKQPEFALTLDQYLERVVNNARVEKGRQLLRENKPLLTKVAERYGVQPRYVVALWGIETDFGRLTGGFKVVPALATLAYDGRRSLYFRNELINALKILERDKFDPDEFTGSWAGAMGQNQFMPSTYLSYAVDFDGDNKPDIWRSRPDVFASTSNYLSKIGWKGDETWGREVKLPANFDQSLVNSDAEKTVSDWAAAGVRSVNGQPLPAGQTRAMLVVPSNGQGRAFLAYANFRAIMKWNKSTSFAIAVGTLADRIGDG